MYTNRPRRGRGSYSSHGASSPSDHVALPPDRDITQGLRKTPIRIFIKPVASVSPGEVIKPENVKYVGSYNWVDEPHPTIIVPGASYIPI